MDEPTKLSHLMDIAQDLGLEVRNVPGSGLPDSHPGGAVIRLKGRPVVFLDPSAALPEQIDVLAAALRKEPALEQRFIQPEIRQILDQADA